MAALHDRKSHDYASDENPMGNYHFAGEMSQLFHNPHDAGFIGRIGEKLYRLANLENSGKIAKNETVEDTEKDICVITALWMADRRDRRSKEQVNQTMDHRKSPMEQASEDAECAIIQASNFLTDRDLNDSIQFLQAVAERRNMKLVEPR